MDQVNFPDVLACRENSQSPVFSCTDHTGSEISRFWYVKTVGRKIFNLFLFALLITTLCRFCQVNRKILSYTLLFINQLSVMSK